MSPIAGGGGPAHSASMTITEELPPGSPAEPPPVPPGEAGPDPSELPPFRRSSTRRLLAGVCGGIADRFDVDVTIVRVGFVVAACLWGVGVVVYTHLTLPTKRIV